MRVYASASKLSSGFTGDKIITYRGYATNWSRADENGQVFHSSYVILTTIVALLDFFVFCFSLGICSNVYDSVYEHIKCKKNPYYPLFWSVVLLCIIWDAGPGWLVLSAGTSHVRAIIGVMVPLQLVLAVFMKKYVDFPVPGLNWKKLSLKYQGYRHQPETGPGDIQNSGRGEGNKKQVKYFFWEVTKLRLRVRVATSFIVQTLAVWGLLIFFTYIVIYTITISISLYLFPIQTLLKIIFIKAVAFCAVFDVGLLFSTNSWKYRCNRKALVINIGLLIQLLTVISFLPLLVFLSFVIGGIIFTDSTQQLNGIQGILALLPSAFLILIGWYSRGTLFPEELVTSGSIEKDEEKIIMSNTSQGDSVRPSLAEKAKAYMESSSSISKYGSTEPTKSDGGDERDQLVSASKAV